MADRGGIAMDFRGRMKKKIKISGGDG